MNDVTSQFPSQFDVAQAPADGSVRRAAVRVWDLPTRVFHGRCSAAWPAP